jgi:hypothetical protein
MCIKCDVVMIGPDPKQFNRELAVEKLRARWNSSLPLAIAGSTFDEYRPKQDRHQRRYARRFHRQED